MWSPQVIFKGLVARLLPAPPTMEGPEGERAVRMSRYGEPKIHSIWPTDHLQADQGGYFIATMAPAQTAIQAGIQSAFVATQVQFALVNGDTGLGKRCYLRKLRLNVLTVGTSGVDLRYAVVTDAMRTPTTLSSPSGTGGVGPGTAANQTAYRAPVVSPNADSGVLAIGIPYFTLGLAGSVGGATVPAATGAARIIVAQAFVKTTAIVAKDQLVIQFGSADHGGTVQGASASAKITEHAPPVIIGPGQCALIYLWSTSNITAGNAFDDASLEWTEE